jgi:HPt (histidine-containing phosphotransfer) domain-containing protein
MNVPVDHPPPGALDREPLDQLRRLTRPGKPSILPRLVELYTRTTPAQIAAIGAAVAERDHAALRFLCHTLKSSSASLGATHLASLLSRVEALARDHSDEGVEALCAELTLAHAAALRALAALPDLQKRTIEAP